MLKKSEMKGNKYVMHNITFRFYLLNSLAAPEYAKCRKRFLVLSRLCRFNTGGDNCFDPDDKIFSKTRGEI